MKYAFILGFLGMLLLNRAWSGGSLAWLQLWTGLSLVMVGLGYAWLGARIFGKRPNGTLDPLKSALLLPYLLLCRGTWHVQRFFSREECCHEIVPGLWLGRRPFLKELPEKVNLVVDLAAEFPAARGVAAKGAYWSYPMLDASIMPSDRFIELVRRIACQPDGVYIHCAQGHGRSAMLTAAVLRARGSAGEISEAEGLIRKQRPQVKINHNQRRLLTNTWADLNMKNGADR